MSRQHLNCISPVPEKWAFLKENHNFYNHFTTFGTENDLEEIKQE